MNERTLLYIDGYSSRIIPEFWEQAQQYNMDVVCLPYYSSTVTQACDRGINAV